ncbi:MAG TPA: TatD family hydrolase [Vicinamibacterales bacterium]|nr:TatD family hydrolase [Vicinamibacterales bacterium]
MGGGRLIDSHCHLADEAFAGDLGEVVARARQAGVASALCILAEGDAAEAAAAARLREMWPAVQFSVGVHPHNAAAFAGRPQEAADAVRRDVLAHQARAIGEIGLDYHYDFAPRDVQQEVFEAQVALAREVGLPLVIHTREAAADTLDVLRRAGGGGVRGVFHCFTGDTAMAREVLDLGFSVSLSGIVSFPRAGELREVARLIPAERLLIETDAPYLAPVPHRGRRNEPALVVRVAEEVAALRGVSLDELGALVSGNFDRFLGPTLSA